MTLWELWTYGEEPWIGMRAIQVLEAVEKGNRLRRPEKAPKHISDLMYSCWTLEAADRPDFTVIHSTLSQIKFEILEANANHISQISLHVPLKKGEKFIVLEEVTSTTVRGQNMTTRKYGHVLKDVLRRSQPVHQPEDPEILKPSRTSHPLHLTENPPIRINNGGNDRSRNDLNTDNEIRVSQPTNSKTTPAPQPPSRVIFSDKRKPPELPQSKKPTLGDPTLLSPRSSSFRHPNEKESGNHDMPKSSGNVTGLVKRFDADKNSNLKIPPPTPPRRISPPKNTANPEVPSSSILSDIKGSIKNTFISNSNKSSPIGKFSNILYFTLYYSSGWNPPGEYNPSPGIYPDIPTFVYPANPAPVTNIVVKTPPMSNRSL